MPGKCRLIGITGGIGAGKSVVSRVLKLRGIPVYDCDYEARLLMDNSPEIKRELAMIAGREVLCEDGSIHRPRLAQRLFACSDVRSRVNALVHKAVREHFSSWLKALDSPVAAVESAILASSSLSDAVDEIWLVEAPEQLRIERVMLRNSLTEAQVRERIEAQKAEFSKLPPHKIKHILNDNATPLLPRISCLLSRISYLLY